MKAVVYDRFGPPSVLQTRDVPPPVPRAREVLVRVRAAALNPKDVLVRKGRFAALSGHGFPRTPGYDLAGVVASAGAGCRRLRAGEEVYGMINAWRGGACAEYVVVPEDELAAKPPSLCMQEAAALPLACLTALQALRDLVRLQPGERVCINGAGGGVGTVAVQIAKSIDAHVTAVCSLPNAGRARELGADRVLDYRSHDLAAGAESFDVFFDVFGSCPHARVRRLIPSARRYVSTIPNAGNLLREGLARFGLDQPRMVLVKSRHADIEWLSERIASGVLRPVIDRIFTLEHCREAQAYLETRRARGKVVISI